MILLYHTDIIIVDFISGGLKKNLVFLQISECTCLQPDPTGISEKKLIRILLAVLNSQIFAFIKIF